MKTPKQKKQSASTHISVSIEDLRTLESAIKKFHEEYREDQKATREEQTKNSGRIEAFQCDLPDLLISPYKSDIARYQILKELEAERQLLAERDSYHQWLYGHFQNLFYVWWNLFGSNLTKQVKATPAALP